MSREIKFRAWVDEYNCYFRQFSMMSSGVGIEQPMIEITIPSGGHSDFKKWINSNFFTIEQYTGLKDKNGVEIYEGDILKCHYQVNTLAGSAYEKPCKVEYDENLGFIPVQEPIDYGEVYAKGYDWEVVGNIHENPELLK